MVQADAHHFPILSHRCSSLDVDIYPLKIHLTDQTYRAMWGYLFPEEEQDSQRRQIVLISLNCLKSLESFNFQLLLVNVQRKVQNLKLGPSQVPLVVSPVIPPKYDSSLPKWLISLQICGW